MRKRAYSSFLAVLVGLLIGAGFTFGVAGRAVAQDAEESHPAHIHNGNCDAPGEVLFPLSNVSSEFLVDGTPAAGAMAGTEGDGLDVSVTNVASSLSDLVAAEHAIVVHESKENIQNYLVCGNVGGTMMGTSDLPIALSELNDSGYNGVAMLHDNGDGTTRVTVFLLETGSDEGNGEMEATPPPSAATGDTVAVNIVNFAYDQPTLNIKAGTTVTWTNKDSTAHTVTADGGAFQSGKIDPGASFSFTFDTAGNYPYHCEFHANMTGTVDVS